MSALTPSEVKEFVLDALRMNFIPYISGPPAIGKSDIVAEIAKQFNLKLLDIRLSQMLPEDLTGLPSLNDKTKKAEYNPFNTFPMDGDAIPNGYKGWLVFLDELSSSSEEIFAAIYSLLLGHRVGGKLLHEKAFIVAAGNRSTDSAIARPLPDTLITRMLPVEMKVSAKDWLEWAKRPENDQAEVVVDFIEKYPDLLYTTVDPSKRDELETYNTPRGWAKISNIIRRHEAKTKSLKITRKDPAGLPMGDTATNGAVISPGILCLMQAAVGITAGKSFQEHYDESISVPYPWEVAQSPSSTRIPATTIAKAKLTADLADHFIDTQEQSRDAILQFMNRMDPEHASLFAEIVKEKIGDTSSDRALIASIKKRLNVTIIDSTKTINDPNEPDGNIPFFKNQNPFQGKGVQGAPESGH